MRQAAPAAAPPSRCRSTPRQGCVDAIALLPGRAAAGPTGRVRTYPGPGASAGGRRHARVTVRRSGCRAAADADVPAVRLHDRGPAGRPRARGHGLLRPRHRGALLKTVLLTESDLTGTRGHEGHAQRMPSRRNAVDPLQLRPATTSCTSSTASASTSRWSSAPSTAASASTWCSSTRRPSAASRGDRLFVPTDSLEQRHPVRRRRGADAAPARRRGLGRRPRVAPRRPSRRSRPS